MRALLSVYFKDGVVEFARVLDSYGVELVSTGGTASALRAAGLPVTDVADITGYPAMLDDRVKTLHPVIHGGILGDLDNPTHVEEMLVHNITAFDFVVVNLYPFTSDPSIKLIDVGGPTMVRGAAKNYQHVTVVVDPSDYAAVIEDLRQSEYVGSLSTSLELRYRLASTAFAHTAAYDAEISQWFAAGRSAS